MNFGCSCSWPKNTAPNSKFWLYMEWGAPFPLSLPLPYPRTPTAPSPVPPSPGSEGRKTSNWIGGCPGQPIRSFVYLPPIFNRSCEDWSWEEYCYKSLVSDSDVLFLQLSMALVMHKTQDHLFGESETGCLVLVTSRSPWDGNKNISKHKVLSQVSQIKLSSCLFDSRIIVEK